MTQFAYFDHTAASPARVIGWYDDSTGGSSPPSADLLEITDPAIWAARFSNAYYVSSNAITQTGPGPALSTVQTQQIAILTQACQVAVTGGYTSNALGAAYHYPSDQTSQQNLIACIVSTLLPDVANTFSQPFWCQNTTSSAWTMAGHTIGQIQQVGQDAKAMIQNAQVKLANLSTQVWSANTVNAVQAVTWA